MKGKGRGGVTQVQPAFASVSSVTPCACASVGSPEETSSADDGSALGPDGDAHAPIANKPTTANKVHARRNTFDMLGLRESDIG